MKLNRTSKRMVYGIATPLLAITLAATLLSIFRPAVFYSKDHGGDQYSVGMAGGRIVSLRISPSWEYFVQKPVISQQTRFDFWPGYTTMYLDPNLQALPPSQANQASFRMDGLQVPFWIIGLPLLLFPLWLAHRSGWSIQSNACSKCRYDLSATAASVCPECGSPTQPQAPAHESASEQPPQPPCAPARKEDKPR